MKESYVASPLNLLAQYLVHVKTDCSAVQLSIHNSPNSLFNVCVMFC